MSLVAVIRNFAVAASLVGSLSLLAQSGIQPEGGEYGIAGSASGDQVYPSVSIRPGGGYLVWQDNITDGSGLGISARRLDSSLSGTMSTFRVNAIGTDDQERPCVSLFNDGGALFVWEGGKQSFQHIYGRILSAAGTWVTSDLTLSTTNSYQLESAVATLTNGNAVVTWSSFNQVSATSLRDVYLQVVTPAGTKFGGETLVNQTTAYNQRSAAVAPLSDGRFVVVWVSEQQRFENSVDVYGRIFASNGSPAGSEFLINSGTNVCANPSVAASPDGGFAVSWSEFDAVGVNGWDVVARPFNASAVGGVTRVVNSHLAADQIGPKISALGANYLVVWTSTIQDGAREGVFGQFLAGDGALSGSEFRVNTTIVSQQIYPTLASDGTSRFLATWSSFVGGTESFDLYSQRYVNLNAQLASPAAPFVSVLGASALGISWPAVQGMSVLDYEVYADGAATPTAFVTNNVYWNHNNLTVGSTHSYRLAYMLTDGRRSPLSAAVSATTYTYPFDWYGIPYDWMMQNFGANVGGWPNSSVDSDGDGVSNLQEWLQGTDPKSAASVLNYSLRQTAQGLFLDWNTQAGLVYQVQVAPSPQGSWTNLGGPRFSAGTVDSTYVGGSQQGYYRVGRVR